MMSLPDRSRVLVPGWSAPGAAGSGICLTHTTTFMTSHLCGPGPFPAIRPGDERLFRSPAAPGSPRTAPAGDGRPLDQPVRDDGVDAGPDHGPEVVGGVDRPDVDRNPLCV